MPKRKLRVKFRIPSYVTPRAAWRRAIHAVASEAVRAAHVAYSPEDRLELEVRIYLTKTALAMHDVDNRLKDIMDALQGHVQGTGKKGRALPALIPNDSQVFKVTVEKQYPPGQSHGLGHVTIRRYDPRGRGR
jgi:Holliday junction resolvase RusA-like endonuclease